MVHFNGAFPAIKGNPTTNYTITLDDEKHELDYLAKCCKYGWPYPPHEPYIGEYPNN